MDQKNKNRSTPGEDPGRSPPVGQARDNRRSPRRLTLAKKITFSIVSTFVFAILLELILSAAGVHPVLDDEDPYVGFSRYIPLFVEKGVADSSPVMATAKNKLKFFNRQKFSRKKDPDTYRIFCLGGSTTYGRPYMDPTSFCGWLRAFLPDADPSKKWEVINAGGISYASYRVAHLMEELVAYDCDLFIIYSGHNEFLERRTYSDILDQPGVARDIGTLLSYTRTYAAVKQIVRSFNQAAPDTASREILPDEVKTRLDNVIGPADYARDDLSKTQTIDHYRHNLSRMVELARSAGAKVVIVVPAVNLRNCSPFKSQHRMGLLPNDLVRWQEHFDRAEAHEIAGEFQAALTELNQAVGLDDRYAELHFRRGRVLHSLGQHESARSSFERALEEDVCPLRALKKIQSIARKIAGRQDTFQVDFAELVTDLAEHKIPGNGLFLDHVHPTVDGNRRLALAILDTMIEAKIVLPSNAWNNQAISRITQTVNSGLDSGDQATMLLNLAKVMSWAGKIEEAAGLTEKVLELDSTKIEAHRIRAFAYLKREEYILSAKHYRAATVLRPDDVDAHSGLATVLMHAGKLNEAETSARRSVQLQPEKAGCHFVLGQVLAEQSKATEAILRFRRAIELEPEMTAARIEIGKVLASQGASAEAVKHLETAFAMRPGGVGILSLIGNIHQSQGQFAPAIDTFEKALKLDPSLTAVMNNLAWLYATCPVPELRNADRAIELAEHSCRRTSFTNPEFLDTCSAAYAAAGQFDKATETAKQALTLAEAASNPTLADAIGDRLLQYQSEKAYRDVKSKPRL